MGYLYKNGRYSGDIYALQKLKTASVKPGTQIWVNCHKSFLYIYFDIHVY